MCKHPHKPLEDTATEILRYPDTTPNSNPCFLTSQHESPRTYSSSFSYLLDFQL